MAIELLGILPAVSRDDLYRSVYPNMSVNPTRSKNRVKRGFPKRDINFNVGKLAMRAYPVNYPRKIVSKGFSMGEILHNGPAQAGRGNDVRLPTRGDPGLAWSRMVMPRTRFHTSASGTA